jgi:ABC-type polysaccharide/polyol phosphate export permease
MAHRNLLYLLSLKELRTRYKKSVLGWAWSLFNPISQMLIFTVIFIYVFKSQPPVGDPSGLRNFPLFFLAGMLPFNFFSITVGTAIGAVQGGAGLIKKVQFPHEHLVFSIVIAQFVTLVIELSILTIAMAIAGSNILPQFVALLVVLLLLAGFTSGVALTLAAANVFYHDVNYLWGILSQILFYATPVIYDVRSLTLAPLKAFAEYGPTGSFITAVHNIVYDLRLPSGFRMAELVILSVGTFSIGLTIYNKLSPKFAEEM